MTVQSDTTPSALAPFEDSTELLDDVAALRARGDRDGFLFFKGLLPAADVEAVRDDLYRALEREGTLDTTSPGAIRRDYLDAIPADEMRLDIGVSEKAYVKVQEVESMHELPHHPRLIDLYERLFAEEVFVHPRHIVRAVSGHPAQRPTPAHQDFPLIQGSQNTWTAWFPLDDTPISRGPLSVLRGSQVNGYVAITPSDAGGGVEAILCDDENDWVGGAFEKGDVLTFPSLTVHRAVKAVDKSRIRLSMDIRFQPASEPIEAMSLTNHSGASWEEIYAGWSSDALQYYWSATTPRISPWDDSYIQPGQRIC